ncbi:hypothetical protein [Paenibacillus sp. FSL H7-0326]|uniref:hypothetical protein n=1 Tax=Paenibacillus sp. FSL H7-0326 TaxID=1921144 RepID=UPI0009FA7106|nr:hypothetical protein [Paenibacillus sp. FSL H7-0326]
MDWSNFIQFLLFSTLEMFAAFVFMMALFRMNPFDYVWQASIVAILMGLQSFFLRGEIGLASLAPVVNIMLYILLLKTVVKMPILWAAIISCTGYFIYAFIQSLFVSYIDGQQLQLVTSILIMIVSFVLYKFGIGFARDFNKLILKGEHIIVVAIIIVTFILLGLTMYLHQIWMNILFFGITTGIFLYYAIKKERED